jgi:hypothetical protein
MAPARPLFVCLLATKQVWASGEGNCSDQTENTRLCKECCANLQKDYEFMNYNGIPKSCTCRGEVFDDDGDDLDD